MSRNMIFCAAGALLGFLIGFLIANSVSHVPFSVASSRTTPSQGAARPLDPEEANTQLPPNHPDISGADSGGGGGVSGGSSAPAATSPVAQGAMEKADRAPKDFAAQMEAAEAFYKLNDFDKAALYLDRALALRPKDVDALAQMGNTKYDAGDYVAAAAYYERALALKPGDPNVRTDLGNTFFKRNPPDYERAIAEYRKSVAVDPRHEQSWQNMTAAAIQIKDKATAVEALRQLMTINPQHPALDALRQGVDSLP